MSDRDAEYGRKVLYALSAISGPDHVGSRDPYIKDGVAMSVGCLAPPLGGVVVAWAGVGLPDDVPEVFREDRFRSFIERNQIGDTEWAGLWDALDKEKVEGAVLREIRRGREEAEASWSERYGRMACPCCGEGLYLDRRLDALVKEAEPAGKVDESTVKVPVRFSYGGCSFTADLSRLYLADKVLAPFGCGGLLISARKEAVSYVLFRTADGMFRGALLTIQEDPADADPTGQAEMFEASLEIRKQM